MLAVTALYELILAKDTDLTQTSVDELRFQNRGSLTSAADSEELAFVKLRYKAPDGDESRLVGQPLFDRRSDRGASSDLTFASAVAGWGMLLRQSERSGDLTLEDVERMARASIGDDPGGFRAEFVELVEATRRLTETVVESRRD